MWEFILDNSVFLIFALFMSVQLIGFFLEYFPLSPRYSESLMSRYVEYQMYMRYEHGTRRFLPQNQLHQFNEREGRDTSSIQRPETTTTTTRFRT